MARRGPRREDVRGLAERMDALRLAREQQVLKGATEATTEAMGAQEERQRTLSKAKTEGKRVAGEAERLSGTEARAMELDTAAIERNRAAQERLNVARRRAAVDNARAARGARDPAFSRAAALADPHGFVSQYAIRQQIEGVGSRRAGDIQHALAGGFRPGGAGADRPFTRLQSAVLAREQSEAAVAEANRHLASVRRSGGASDAERLEAVSARELALATREAAKLELESAEKEAAARAQNAEAARKESAGRALIRHPELFGQGLRGDYEGIGRRVPRTGVAFERRASGEPYMHSGAEAYDRDAARRMAQQAQAKGDLTTATNQYASALTAEQRAQHVETYARAAQYERQMMAATNGVFQATQHSAVGFGTMSQQMHRHGALTSEFIAAAARGEVTLRELGNQAVVTAGKFGGWTLAASALFAAARAIHQIGEGAISSSAGVNTLRRVIGNVDSDKAQQAFSDLSRQFNVPIDVAVDSVYRMGQRFHDLPSAVEAAKASLYSFKTGEVDVGTSTENLIAIVNGFHLTAKDLSGVYDQINQAQNTFGIRIGDTEAGLAKAAGTYKNAGGDLNYLLGLFVAISRATNRSGQEIGTGLARGVNQIRQASNQAKLEAQGVDVDPGNFQKTIQSAMEAARRPGADLQQIATGLFGNQYARLIAPVLADQKTLNAALGDTSPEKSKGSAQKELAKVLGQVDEQISKVGNNLERMGAALARSGLLLPLAGLLKGLNGALDITTRLVEEFDKLPHGLREAVALIAEGAILLKGLQRFGGTDRLANTQLAFLSKPDARLKTYATRGARDFQNEAYNVQERTARNEFQARERADAARQRANEFQGQYASRRAAGTLPPKFSDERLDLERERIEVEREAGHYATQANRAATETLAAKNVAVRAERQLAEVQALQGAALRRYLHEQNIAIPATLGTPGTRGTRRLARNPLGEGARIDQLQFARDYGRITQGQMDEAVTRGYTARAAQMRSRIQGWSRSAGEWLGQTGRVATAMGNVGSRVVARGASTVEQATARLGLAGMRSAPAKISGAMRGLAAGLGVMDLALIGLVTWETLVAPKLQAIQKRQQEAEGALAKAPTSVRQQQERDAQLARLAQGRQAEGVEGVLSRGLYGKAVAAAAGRETPQESIDREQKQAQIELDREARLQASQRRQRRQGRPVANLYGEQVKAEVAKIGEDVAQGYLSLTDAQDALAKAGIEAEHSVRIGKAAQGRLAKQRAQIRRQIAAQLDPSDFDARFGGANADELRQWMGVTTTRLGTAGYQPKKLDFSELSSEYNRLTKLQANARTPADLQKVAQDRDNFYKVFGETAQRQIQEGLALARTEGDRRDAFSAARETIGHEADMARGQLQRSKVALTKAQQGGDAKQITKAIHDYNQAKKNYSDALKRQALDLQQVIDAEYEDRQQGRQINLSLANSKTQDQGTQAANSLRTAQRQLEDARKTYGVHDRRYKQALQAVNEARVQQAQALLANVEADNALLIANAGTDPVAQARAAERAAQNTLSAMQRQQRSHPGTIDPNAVKQQRAAVITAHNATLEAQRSEAAQIDQLLAQIDQARAGGDQVVGARAAIANARRAQSRATNRQERLQATLDLINAENDLQAALRDRAIARIDLLASRTTDPVAQARYAVQSARAALRGTKGTDRLRAQAELNRSLQAYRDAALQDKEGTIDFNLQMGNISKSVAISQLQSLLQLHNLTKEQRRDLKLKIKALQDQSDQEASGFDLDVGNIKLPTIYDIRRAFDPVRKSLHAAREGAKAGIANDITASVSHMHDMRTQVQAQISIIVNDPNAAGQVYDALDRAMGTTVAARMRSAGMR